MNKPIKTFLIALLFVLALSSSALAQKKEGYIFFPDRGYVYYFPIDNSPKVDNIKDTAKYQFNDFLLKEYKGKVFKNHELLSEVTPGDTIQVNTNSTVQFFYRRKK